jgi:predicted ATPase
MKSLIIEGVRAFKKRVQAPLGKLTLLVGQNSSGKSTFLACARLAWDIASGRECDFNEQPFELGTYESIAHYHGGQGKRVREFTIGAEFSPQKEKAGGQQRIPFPTDASKDAGPTVIGVFQSDHGSPTLNELRETDQGSSLELIRKNGKVGVTWTEGGETRSLETEVPRELPLAYVPRMIPPDIKSGQPLSVRHWTPGLFNRNRSERPYALAPVRSRPRRTYDPIRDIPNPEGEHVPALLSRLQAQAGKQWESLKSSLQEFGNESGLFSQISIRSYGKEQQGEPFQINVAISGQAGTRNLLDVGYGVGQILPILVESALGPRGRMLLLQQPEVHLHPQAQAALGSYLARSAGDGAVRYVVETHSDYIVDRVAMAIRDPKHPLKAKDVSLLFFEAEESGVHVHTLGFSETGDVIDPPPGYRRFFLDEQARYLGSDS